VRSSLSPARSLRRLATIAWVSAAISLIVGTVVIAAGFTSLLDARSRVFGRLEPAIVETQRLRASAVDQETGLRGYALTRDERLLQPYTEGLPQQRESEAELRSLLRDDPFHATLDDQVAKVDAALRSWRRQVATPILAAPLPADSVNATMTRSKASFDQVRGQIDGLERALIIERDRATHQLNQATEKLVISVGAAVALLGLVSLAASLLLRHQVVEPIGELVAAADSITAGQMHDPIDVRGPAEIEYLAQQVSFMRDRILEELAEVDRARLELADRANELARSNADLEQFAYVASHDLQEPLRKVASFCQLLEQRYGDQLDERAQSYIEFAVDGAKRMQALIADLLEFSRLGRTTNSFVPCDLERIAQDTATRFDDALAGGMIEIVDLPTVAGDPTLYGALFQNLIGNAIKYHREGVEPVIRLSATRDGSIWQFACADNGIGIDPTYRDRVFAIFQRLHSRDAYSGTGIGLALCRKIVEFSGGQIWIGEPEDHIGTVVCWTLPASPPASSPPPRQEPLDAAT